MFKSKGIFTWRQCNVFLTDSACIEDGFARFNEGSSNEMLVCECKTPKLAEKISYNLNKELTKWDSFNSLIKD